MIVHISIILVLFTKQFHLKVIENNIETTVKYNPEELLINLFNVNNTTASRQNGYGLVKFEGDQAEITATNLITFDDSERGQSPLKFQDDNDLRPTQENDNNQVAFKDEDQQQQVEDKPVQKKRRRRRRPRVQRPPGVYPSPVNPAIQQYQGQGYPGIQNFGQYGLQQGNYVPGYGFPQNRPSRRRPATPDALSSIITALTSIARYDDQQCVPRLLCEAAGGALGSSNWLQTVTGLQPLLSLLSAYNGVSTSPLFIFGRAVFLGMTSKGNPSTCRYAYNSCPTDPEELVYYLNNHNGGFFRFFNAPQRPTSQQNLEQFYNQLSGQYGFLQPNYPTNQQNYGYPGLPGNVQSYELYAPQNSATNPVFPNPNDQYGFNGGQNQLYNPQNQQNYGNNYPYDQFQYGLYNNRFRIPPTNQNHIQKRIQNKPNSSDNDNFDNNDNFKWTFPDNHDVTNNFNDKNHNNFVTNSPLLFPQQNNDIDVNQYIKEQNYRRDVKGFQFPERQNNYGPIYVIPNYTTSKPQIYSNNAFRFDNNNNLNKYQTFSSAQYYNENKYTNNKNYYQGNNDQVRTVYVVRGNGDPNNPEIIMLKPGENVS